MRKSQSVVVKILGTVAAMALNAGCGSPETPTQTPTHKRICVDKENRPVDEAQCAPVQQGVHHPHGYVPLYHWYYMPYHQPIYFGSPVYGGSYTAPGGAGANWTSGYSNSYSNGAVRGGAGTVRGGFGSTAHPGFGGGGSSSVGA